MSEGELILAILGIMTALLSPLYMEVFKLSKKVAQIWMLIMHGKPNRDENCVGVGAGRLDAPPSAFGGLEAIPAQTGERS